MERRPNILWLTTDHHIYANHYEYQSEYHGKLKTYERLCSEGTRYRQAYTACPLCTPARATMLTGQYPHRHGMILNTPMNAASNEAAGTRVDFDSSNQLISGPLLEKGYRVAQFGKWYGGAKTADELGFEGWTLPWYGDPMRSDVYAQYRKERNLPEPEVEVLWSANEPDTVGKRYNLTHPYRYAFGPFSAARRMLSPKECHEAYLVSSLACDWLIDYSSQEDAAPFFLKVDVWGPHHPYDAAVPFDGTVCPENLRESPNFRDNYENKPRQYTEVKRRWANISNMTWEDMSQVIAVSYEQAMLVDDALGKILDQLDRLGLADNTLVIYTADHGDLLGAHGGLFNKEGLMVEETMKIPMAMRWPGVVEKGAVSDELVSNMDIPVTAMAVAGAKPGFPVDGIDVFSEHRECLMSESFGCFAREFEQKMYRWSHYKYIAHESGEEELYDLQEDPFELQNLAQSPKFAQQLLQGQQWHRTGANHHM